MAYLSSDDEDATLMFSSSEEEQDEKTFSDDDNAGTPAVNKHDVTVVGSSASSKDYLVVESRASLLLKS